MVKAVIFDLDDTLISEKKYIESGYCHIAKILSCKLGIVEADIFSELIDLFNESPMNVFNRLLDKYGFEYTKEMILDLVAEYRNHFPRIELYDDVLPCLEYLKSKAIKSGIITDGYANAQHKKLKAIRAYDYFDEVIITDKLGREFWKPHPKAFEIMRDKMRVKFDEMIYVGDNPEKDFYIGKIYPIKTVRIHRESVYRDSIYLKEINEVHSIHSLIEINAIVEQQ